MIDQKKLAVDLSNKIAYQPLLDLLLVKPLKPVMITKLVPVPPVNAARNLADAETQEPTEPQKQKVEANIRKGIVLKLGTDYATNNPAGLEVGDVVLYPTYAGLAFELLKDARLLRRYDVVGKVTA
jgi:co-chaperonin GroES (HSP10)